MMSREPLVLKLKITGMDCAACARKIENAVSRIPGASDAAVGVTNETLTVTLATPEREPEVTAAVKGLGYRIASETRNAPDRDHDEHAQPIESHWWRSAKGQLVLLSGGLIAVAYVATLVAPQYASIAFLAACVAGVLPVVKRAVMAARSGAVFTIEMLMSIAGDWRCHHWRH